MKKTILRGICCVAAAVMLCFSLSACDENYTPKQKQEMSDQGKALVQEFLKSKDGAELVGEVTAKTDYATFEPEHDPDAEIEFPEIKTVLTGYVTADYKYDGEKYEVYINTDTGDTYDNEGIDSIKNEIILAILDSAGIPDNGSFMNVQATEFKTVLEYSHDGVSGSFAAYVIPSDKKDPEIYISGDPGNTELIAEFTYNGDLSLPKIDASALSRISCLKSFTLITADYTATWQRGGSKVNYTDN